MFRYQHECCRPSSVHIAGIPIMRRRSHGYVIQLFVYRVIITARKSLGQGNVFTLVCLFTGGSAYRGSTYRGVCLLGEGLPTWGGSASGGIYIQVGALHLGGGSPSGWGICIWGGSASRGSASGGRGQTPSKLERRAVRFLLECFLVYIIL